jgi:cation/acetate symporter
VSARALSWLVVAGSFAGYLVVLLWVRTRTAGVFYAPTRQVRPAAEGAAAAASWISAASFLSLGGAMALSGPDGAVYPLGWIAGFALLALLVAPYLRRAGRQGIPQLLAGRFGSPAAGTLAVACAMLVSFTYLSAQLRGAAIVLAHLVPLPLPAAVAAALAVVLGYTALGRLRTLTGGQVAQYLVLATAFLILAGALLQALTGGLLPQAALTARLDGEGARLLGQPPGLPLRQALDGLGLPPHGRSQRGLPDLLASGLSLVAGTAALPHIVGRFLAMPRAREARRSAGWALLLVALFYSAAPAVGLSARAALVAAGREGPARERLAGWGGAGIDPDALVLAAPEVLGLPPWVAALAVAGALAAAVSAAAGLVLSLGSAAARDLLRGRLLPGLSDRAERRAGRLAAAGLTALAAWLALHPPGTVVQTVALAFGVAAAAFFPALLAAAFWRRATRQGVLLGMATGALFTIGYVHWFRFLRPELDGPASWWLGISPEGIGAVGALLGAAVLALVSLLSPAPAAGRDPAA